MDSASRTVMIVDDEPFFRQLLRDILTNAGFTVVAEAADGSEAVAHYRVHRPAVVIMDIFMPETNGIEATQELLSVDPGARVLICSGVGYDENVEAALKAGAREVIFKPFIPEEVTQTIEKMLA